jgi:hypothetical protein
MAIIRVNLNRRLALQCIQAIGQRPTEIRVAEIRVAVDGRQRLERNFAMTSNIIFAIANRSRCVSAGVVWWAILILPCQLPGQIIEPIHPPGRDVASARPSWNSLSELLIRLQSDRFSVRQKAMYEIMQDPAPVIPMIEESIRTCDADFRKRALKILEQVALNPDSTSNLAFETLRRISLSDDKSLAQKAGSASFGVLVYKQYKSALNLERLNAIITSTRTVDNQKYPLVTHLVVGENWKGTRADLDQIRHLFGLSSLELTHEQVDDELIAALDSIYTLQGVKLKRCSITDSSIRYLAKSNTISQLEVLYCPIGAGCFDSLAEFAHLTSVRLIGTDVDPADTPLLEQKLNATVDIRRGAFLGIRYNPTEPGCRLTSLVPGSAAEKSGLRIGDLVLQFDQQPIDEYGDLTRILRQKRLGDKALVKVKRNGKDIVLEVVMGEWE